MGSLLPISNRRIAGLALAFIFIYHGLVPKLLFLSSQEVAMIQAHGDIWPVELIASVAGVAEILLGTTICWFRHKNWPILIALVALVLLLADAIIFSPEMLAGAFNPVTTNIAAIALCLIALGASQDSVQRNAQDPVQPK